MGQLPHTEYQGWLRFLTKYGGDYRTHHLLATLCAIQVSTKEKPVTALDFLPWLRDETEPEPLDAYESETLEEYMKRVG